MKRLSLFSIVALALVIACVSFVNISPKAQTLPAAAAQEKKMPEVIILANDAKLGKVTFSHVKHNSGTYSIDGTSAIACVTCHHTAQPASEVAKYPPLKTAWPSDRTTTLTADLFKKDPNAAGVAACRDCHARVGQKPKLLPEIPVMKHPNSTDLVTMTNQQAFHRTCDVCHFNLGFQRPEAKVPKATQCSSCHKRTAPSA